MEKQFKATILKLDLFYHSKVELRTSNYQYVILEYEFSQL